jgi:hypothetical protein
LASITTLSPRGDNRLNFDVEGEVMKTEQKIPSQEKIMQVGLGFWASKTLLTAVHLGIFTELAKGEQSIDQLTKRFGLHDRGARDFFDALVALGFLKRKDKKYSNTEETDYYLDKAKHSYVGGILEMCDNRLYHSWNSLEDSLKTGRPQSASKGDQNPFDEMYSSPKKLKEFLQAMTGISMGAGIAMAKKFPWKDYQSYADIGCAQGGLTIQIALHHNHLQGIGYDLPVVRPIFEEYVASFNLSNRIKFQQGDFFKEPLAKADVLIMGHILHDWNLAEKKMLIKKAYDALPPGGAFISFEALIDDARSKNAFGLLMSLNMLVETPGGFDYTGADCQGWMKEAGFRQTRVEHLIGPDSMVIGIK